MSDFTPLLSLVEEPVLEQPTEVKQMAARTKNERCFKTFVFMVLLVFTGGSGALVCSALLKLYPNCYNLARIVTVM